MNNKVYIVTVYNSLNPGSFLQATALYNAVDKLGYKACFLKTNARSLFKQTVIESMYLLKRGNIPGIVLKIKSALKFAKNLKAYNVSAKYDENAMFILGSDEIWNIARKEMAKYPVFFGLGLPKGRCFSYAPSINNATTDDFKKHEYLLSALDNLSAISVRDQYSKDNLEFITDKKVVEVCDPTMLLDKSDYINMESECPYSNFILVYVYHRSITDNIVKELQNFAREKGKKLICFGAEYKWCDISVKGDAYDFLAYFHKADYVCTSTFHGTVFSLIYEKKFVVIGNDNRKVGELLDKVELDRSATENNLRELFDTYYDTAKLEMLINTMRKNGSQYLKENIEYLL